MGQVDKEIIFTLEERLCIQPNFELTKIQLSCVGLGKDNISFVISDKHDRNFVTCLLHVVIFIMLCGSITKTTIVPSTTSITLENLDMLCISYFKISFFYCPKAMDALV